MSLKPTVQNLLAESEKIIVSFSKAAVSNELK